MHRHPSFTICGVVLLTLWGIAYNKHLCLHTQTQGDTRTAPARVTHYLHTACKYLTVFGEIAKLQQLQERSGLMGQHTTTEASTLPPHQWWL